MSSSEPENLEIAGPPAVLAPRLYRVPAVAEVLAVSERYVWQLIAEGELRKVTQGKLVAVRDDDLRDYIDAHTQKAS